MSWRDVVWKGLETLVRQRFRDVPEIERERLARQLAQPSEEQPVLLDARTPAEFAVSHLPGAVSAPDAETARAWLGDRLSQPVVLYCSVGVRSARLARSLREAGFRDVRNLEGSIFQWARSRHPLVRASGPATTVHPFGRPWSLLLEPELRAPGASDTG